MDNKIDKYFKNNLENAAWIPGNNVWDKIEQSGVIGEKKGFILPIYAKIAAAAVLTIGLFSAALIWMNQQPNQTPEFAQQDSLYIGEDTTQSTLPSTQDTAPTFKDSTQKVEKDTDEVNRREEVKQSKPESVIPRSLPKSIDNQRKVNTRKRTPSAEEKIGVQEQRAILAQSLTPLDFDLKTNQVTRLTPYEATSMALELAADPPVLEYRSTLDMFEEAGYADKDRNDPSSNDDNTITEKLFQFAGEKLSTFADASGLSFQRLSRVEEIEIVY